MADALLWSLLAGAGTGILGWGLDQMPWSQSKTTNINTDYVNNPIWQMLFGSGGQYGETQKGMESYLQNAITSAKGYDSTAFWKDFLGAYPDLQNIVSGETRSLKEAQQANLSDFVKQAISDTGQELSGMGALYSGAMGSIAGNKIGKQAAQSNTDLAQIQASLLGSLSNNLLSNFSSGRQFQTSSLINSYLGGANLYSSQLMNMLGIGADLSQPIYQQQKGLSDYLMEGLGLGLQGYSAIIMGGDQKKKTTSSSEYTHNYDSSKSNYYGDRYSGDTNIPYNFDWSKYG